MLSNLFKNYKTLPLHILYLAAASFFIQLIDSSFFILLNYHLKSLNFSDTNIAQLTAFKFAAVMLLGFPLGLYIKGKKLLPFFKVATATAPLLAFSALLSLDFGAPLYVTNILVFCFGISSVLLTATTLPFIILNTPKKQHTSALALYYQLFSTTAFLVGVTHFTCSSLLPDLFTEGRMLKAITILSLLSNYFIHKIELVESPSPPVPFRQIKNNYDWSLIFMANIPTLIIAIGAGITIPFMNLFFFNVHSVDATQYSIYGAISFALVSFFTFFIPSLLKKWGYYWTINGAHVLAIIALFTMASTQLFQEYPWALAIAALAFILRQPLMQVPKPATSSLAMYYVGEKNQEMIGASQAAIWSGSWFFGSLIFGWLREMDVSYFTIFSGTCLLYLIGTSWYAILIFKYKQQVNK